MARKVPSRGRIIRHNLVGIFENKSQKGRCGESELRNVDNQVNGSTLLQLRLELKAFKSDDVTGVPLRECSKLSRPLANWENTRVN